MFVFRLPARRRLRYDLNSDCALSNLNGLAGVAMETLPHPDTLAYLLKRLPVADLEALRLDMVRSLLRSRRLEGYRLRGSHYLLALDGTGYLHFSKPHCDKCLHQERPGGQTIYYHPVLEAKLIGPGGLAISVATEFIENTDGQEKQDCELRACYRLLPKLRQDFPQLPICLLLDGLFLNQQVMRMANQLRFRWIITFKEGSLPEAYGEYQALQKLVPQQHLVRETGRIRQEFRWLAPLEHAGIVFSAFECLETFPDGKTRRFVWATDWAVTPDNVEELAEKGGRSRWKIENQGFNTQKNGGYGLEHAYCENWQAAQNFYLLLQIAHLIVQLMEKGSLLAKPVAELFGSLLAFAARLLEAWRNATIDPAELETELSRRIQIRLDTS